MSNTYSQKYYQEHKDKWYEKKTCDVCGGSFSRASHCNHIKTKKHQKALVDKQDKLSTEKSFQDKQNEILAKLNDLANELAQLNEKMSV